MAYLGMFCLGIFVGAFVNVGLGMTGSLDDLSKVLTTVFGAALGGVVLIFIGDKVGNAKWAYPIGLAIMIPWFYMRSLIAMAKQNGAVDQYLGWAAIIATVGATLLALLVVASPALGVNIRDE